MTLCANLGECMDHIIIMVIISVFYVIQYMCSQTSYISIALCHTFKTSLAVPPISCSDNLPTIPNGDITYAGGSTNNRPVNATATYSCITGYTLVGVSVRTCGSDGEWSSTTAPVCQSKDPE